jgi:hypothetical protein
MNSRLCGQAIAGGRATGSPFSKIVGFGYDDGPTTGVVRCAGCSDAYRFDVLAIDVDGIYDIGSWDQGEELRIYALSPLPDGAFDQIVALLSTAEPPRWPIWVPSVVPNSPAFDRLIEKDYQPILTDPDPRLLVAAAGGLLQPIVAVGNHPYDDGRTASDWFALLGFAAGDRLIAST